MIYNNKEVKLTGPILVTGGAGFIGSNVVAKLVSFGETVIESVDDYSAGKYSNLSKLRYNKLFTNTRDDFASDRILSFVKNGCFKTIIHLAAIPRVAYSVEHPVETSEANIMKTVKLLDAAVKGKVKRFIFASSSSVYGGSDVMPTPETASKNPKSPYALQKSVIEDYLKLYASLYGLDCLSLRFFNVFGPNQYGDSAYSTAISAWCNAIKDNKPLRSDGTGEQSRDHCYVDNVVHANILALTSEKKFSGECFNVACGERFTNNEILSFLKNKYQNIIVNDAPWRQGDVMHTQADISSIKHELGYEPLVTFWDGLDKTMNWWVI